MTGDPRLARPPIDDGVIAQLVREVVADWSMPPVRLDAPSWRDRVRSPGTRRVARAGAWLGRVGQAATAALALTVAGALIAVLVTRPPVDPGASPTPSGGASPGSTEVVASLLPKLLRGPDLPDPSEVLVETDSGDFALVDLEHGTIGGPITGGRYGSAMQVLGDGSMVCLCVRWSGSAGGSPTRAEVSVDRYDATGRFLQTVPVRSFDGEPDPRDTGVFIPERPAHLGIAVSFSSDGRAGFVGWSQRAHPAWPNGLLLVDLETGDVSSELAFPDGSTGEGEARRVYDAPKVVGTANADALLVARGWYQWSPAASANASYRFESELFTPRFAGGKLSDPVPMPNAAVGCGRIVDRGGPLPEGGTWIVCAGPSSAQTMVRRFNAEGLLLGEVRVPGSAGSDGDSSALSPDGKMLFVWDAAAAEITRINLATGDQESAKGLTARVDGGALAALGRWLAPEAAAKTYLKGAVVVSPDGTRVYAIGVKEAADERDPSGSAGVFVFGADTLDAIDIWQPTADFVSLALSSDGRFAYAAGLPGVDAVGSLKRDQQASITVYDTIDGSIRLIAGELEGDMITFPRSILD